MAIKVIANGNRQTLLLDKMNSSNYGWDECHP